MDKLFSSSASNNLISITCFDYISIIKYHGNLKYTLIFFALTKFRFSSVFITVSIAFNVRAFLFRLSHVEILSSGRRIILDFSLRRDLLKITTSTVLSWISSPLSQTYMPQSFALLFCAPVTSSFCITSLITKNSCLRIYHTCKSLGFVDKNATLQTKQKGCINRAPENRRTQSEIFGKEEPQA